MYLWKSISAFISTSHIQKKFVYGVKLWFCTTWKGLGFFDIWVMFHTLLKATYNREQLWKIGMKTSELKKRRKIHTTLVCNYSKKEKKIYFSRLLQLHSCIKDYFRRYLCSTLVCILLVRKKSYSIENTGPSEVPKIWKGQACNDNDFFLEKVCLRIWNFGKKHRQKTYFYTADFEFYYLLTFTIDPD